MVPREPADGPVKRSLLALEFQILLQGRDVAAWTRLEGALAVERLVRFPPQERALPLLLKLSDNVGRDQLIQCVLCAPYFLELNGRLLLLPT